MRKRIAYLVFSLFIFVSSACFASEVSGCNVALMQKSYGYGLRNSMSVFSVEDIQLLKDSTGCNILVPNGKDKFLLEMKIAKSAGRNTISKRPYLELENKDLQVIATVLEADMLILITAKYINSNATFLGDDGKVHSYGCTGEIEVIFYCVKDENKEVNVFATNKWYSSPKDVLETLKSQALAEIQKRIID